MVMGGGAPHHRPTGPPLNQETPDNPARLTPLHTENLRLHRELAPHHPQGRAYPPSIPHTPKHPPALMARLPPALPHTTPHPPTTEKLEEDINV